MNPVKIKDSILSVSAISGFLLCLATVLFLTLSLSTAARASTHTYSLQMKPGVRGEYNISVTGSLTSTPKLYKINFFKKLVQIPCTYIWQSGRRVLKCSLEKNTTYKLYLTTRGGKPYVSCKKNLDVYRNSSLTCMRGLEWVPYSNSYQEFSLQGIRTLQIAYLTREEALLYSLNLTRNSYLKLLNTGIKLTQFMVSCGISSSTVLGKKIIEIGKTKLATTAKTIVSTLGGITLLPNLSKGIQDSIRSASGNYSHGIKITVTSTPFGGCTNSYSGWNQQYDSVLGKPGVRGSFSTLRKMKGWY